MHQTGSGRRLCGTALEGSECGSKISHVFMLKSLHDTGEFTPADGPIILQERRNMILAVYSTGRGLRNRALEFDPMLWFN